MKTKVMRLKYLVLLNLVGYLKAFSADECPEVCACSENLTVIDCSGQELTSIYFLNIPKSVKILDLSNNSLKNVANDLGRLVNLIEIDLSRNLIDSSNVRFTYNVLLKSINLQQNQIADLSNQNYFLKNVNLEYLNLANNSLTSESLDPNIFYYNLSLKNLSLGNNFLTYADRKWIERLTNLTVLNWSDNPWDCGCEMYPFTQIFGIFPTAIDTVLCQNPAKFSDIYLNDIEDVMNECCPVECDCYENMKLVDCSSRNLTYIPKFVYGYQNEVLALNMRNNSFSGRLNSDNLRYFTHIEELDYSQNYVSDLDGFYYNRELRWLNLSSNLISTLDKDDLRHAYSLESIDLSSNQLTLINADSFGAHTALVNLDVSENRLTNMSYS